MVVSAAPRARPVNLAEVLEIIYGAAKIGHLHSGCGILHYSRLGFEPLLLHGGGVELPGGVGARLQAWRRAE